MLKYKEFEGQKRPVDQFLNTVEENSPEKIGYYIGGRFIELDPTDADNFYFYDEFDESLEAGSLSDMIHEAYLSYTIEYANSINIYGKKNF